MSEFRSMTVAVERNGEFHTLTLEDGHDFGTVERLETIADMAGWEVVSVVVDGWDFTEEMWPHIDHMSNIPMLFETLCNNPYQADIICAWLTVNDCADVDSWEDASYFYGQDSETIVREWADAYYRVYEETSGRYAFSSEFVKADPFPDWLEIDWDETLSNIARENGSDVVEFNGMTYYFG